MGTPQDVVELLQQLIRIPSVNPDGTPGTDRTGELELARYLGDFTRQLGAEVQYDEVEPDRPNLIARFPGGQDKPRLVLAPHLDTVSVAGMTIPPFDAEIRDNRVYGRGASDTKGPMAAMLWALHQLYREKRSLPFDIWFTGLMGEEAGNDGAIHLAKTLQADFVLVGEPTQMKIVYRHKGALWGRLTTSGLSGHASDPRPHENAILRMATILPELRQLSDHWAKTPDPELGPSTLNIGTIQGGSKVNIVPDRCETELDIRVIDGTAHWRDAVGQILERHQDYASVEYSRALPALNTRADNAFVQRLEKAGSSLDTAPWFCDAAIFAEAGLAAAAMGPGSIAQAHTADEWIDIDELRQGAEFFQSFFAAH